MFFRRDLEKPLERFRKFPVVAILGPRQSGKTTLARHFFKGYVFLSFEDPAIREFATTDPKGFLREYENERGLILDEFQYVPQILSYIQLEVDQKKRPGYFVLTGSQNFLANQAITQSLAGRVGILTLLPFSIHELTVNKLLPAHASDLILDGSYPRVYAEQIPPTDLYPSYINTYVERDVRQLINVGDLGTFQKFLSLCAGRVGQLLNLSDIAMNCGISVPTASKWFSLLEASYILFRLQPHFTNFNKRITKTPKLYFYDTGLVCALLQITSQDTLSVSPFRGNLFENLMVSDLYKQFYNQGKRPPLYFWRDRNGTLEIDCIVDKGNLLIPVEIKASETILSTFFRTMIKWNEVSSTDPQNNYLIYAGTEKQTRAHGRILGWKAAGELIKMLYE